jgi:hypothetical protein
MLTFQSLFSMEQRTKLYKNKLDHEARLWTLWSEAHVLPLLAQPAHRQCTTLAGGASEQIPRCVHAEAMDRAK